MQLGRGLGPTGTVSMGTGEFSSTRFPPVFLGSQGQPWARACQCAEHVTLTSSSHGGRGSAAATQLAAFSLESPLCLELQGKPTYCTHLNTGARGELATRQQRAGSRWHLQTEGGLKVGNGTRRRRVTAGACLEGGLQQHPYRRTAGTPPEPRASRGPTMAILQLHPTARVGSAGQVCADLKPASGPTQASSGTPPSCRQTPRTEG